MLRIKNCRICISFLLLLWLPGWSCSAQKGTNINDPVAGEILDRVAKKYQGQALDIDFTLTTVRPKLKPDEPDAKYTTNENGKLLLKGNRFRIIFGGHEVVCDGKNIWTYAQSAKEAQLNEYDENEETFSPSKIFSLHQSGYSYQIKEKKNFQGKNVTVIELSPANRKVSFFKIDIVVEDGTSTVLESKVYEKNGVRYTYKINKAFPSSATDADFVFDTKSHPGVKVVDLR